MTTPVLRSMLLAAICAGACGAPASAPAPDAGSAADAGPDAGPARGRVRVSAVDHADPTKPGAGLPVRFTDASGAVVVDTMTDANGDAEADVPSGVTVTVAWPDRQHVESVVDVAIGDHLHLGAPEPTVGYVSATMSLSLPAAPGLPHTSVIGPCWNDEQTLTAGAGGALTATIPMRKACTPYQLVAIASDDAGRTQFLPVTVPALVDGGAIAVADPTWRPMPTMHVRVVPPKSTSASVFDVERQDGPATSAMNRDLTITDAFEGDVDAPPVAPTALEIVSLWIDGHTMEKVAMAIPSAKTTSVDDVTSSLVPAATDAAFAAGKVTWALHGDGTADAITVALASGDGSDWSLLVPPGATSVTLPPLPPAAAALWPSGKVSTEVTVDEVDVVDGYDGARNLPSGGLAGLLASKAWSRWTRSGTLL